MVYISQSLVAAGSPEMLGIGRVALERNSQCGVTGYLYFDDDSFLQAIEGLDEDVDAIFASIRRDARHRSVRTLFEGPVESRLFGGWAMGLHDGRAAGGLLSRAVRADIAATAGPRDVPALVRFLHDLSVGRCATSQLVPDVDG